MIEKIKIGAKVSENERWNWEGLRDRKGGYEKDDDSRAMPQVVIAIVIIPVKG